MRTKLLTLALALAAAPALAAPTFTPLCGTWESIDGPPGKMHFALAGRFRLEPQKARTLDGRYTVDRELQLIDLVADVDAYGKTTVAYRFEKTTDGQDVLVERYMANGVEQRFVRVGQCQPALPGAKP